jgi:hypothetical protein
VNAAAAEHPYPVEKIVKFPLMYGVAAMTMIAAHAPALAQHEHHPGMSMPMPAKPTAKKPAPKKQPAKKAPEKAPSKKATAPAGAPPRAEKHQIHAPPGPQEMPVDHSQMDHGTPPAPAAAAPPDHSRIDHAQMGHAEAFAGAHRGHDSIAGALGPYPMQREASGTAWQPDASTHSGLMADAGGWTLMAHGVVNLVYDHQSGPRGDEKAFASGMLMGMARRPIGNGTLQFKAMLSPDPLMGKNGYPLLLASGETANGVDRLIDRQHPHDFFMELSASVSQNIGRNASVFLYAGLPGEPAFGPPAFMHREAILDSPEAPISHHWLDSTHISFGVVTAGLVLGNAKLEVSRFNAREPDQKRWDIETGALDSTAVRLSWNPTQELSLQGSWGHFVDPEQLEPGVDQKRWSASALYAREIAPGWKLAGTLAWGRKTIDHHGESVSDDAWVTEASLKHGSWTLFGRGEVTENRELIEAAGHGDAFRVGKASLGAVRDFRIAGHVSLGAGGLLAVNFVPDGLAAFYGGHNPIGAMGFVRVKLD